MENHWYSAMREAREETSLDLELIGQLHTYSNPSRVPRQHNISTIFIARASGKPHAASDAKSVVVFRSDNLPTLVFDHARILLDYYENRPTWIPTVTSNLGAK